MPSHTWLEHASGSTGAQPAKAAHHLFCAVHGRVLPLVQDVNRCSVEQKKLHHQGMPSQHSLVQGCVAFVVGSIDGGPVLGERGDRRCRIYVTAFYKITF